MSKLGSTQSLQDIWIMHQDGTVLFKHVIEEKLNEQLFGGFMSALESFARTMDENGLSNFVIGQKKFIIKKVRDLLFVVNFDNKVNPKKAATELENVSKKFLSTYQAELQDFRGNVEVFKNFTTQIQVSTEDFFKGLQQALLPSASQRK